MPPTVGSISQTRRAHNSPSLVHHPGTLRGSPHLQPRTRRASQPPSPTRAAECSTTSRPPSCDSAASGSPRSCGDAPITSTVQFPPGLQPGPVALDMSVNPSRPSLAATETFVDLFAVSLPPCALRSGPCTPNEVRRKGQPRRISRGLRRAAPRRPPERNHSAPRRPAMSSPPSERPSRPQSLERNLRCRARHRARRATTLSARNAAVAGRGRVMLPPNQGHCPLKRSGREWGSRERPGNRRL